MHVVHTVCTNNYYCCRTLFVYAIYLIDLDWVLFLLSSSAAHACPFDPPLVLPLVE